MFLASAFQREMAFFGGLRVENFRQEQNLSQLWVELFVVIYFDGHRIRIPCKCEQTGRKR